MACIFHGGLVKRRRIVQFHSHCAKLDYGVPDNTHNNLKRAVLERVYFVKDGYGGYMPPPQPQPDAWDVLMRPFARKLKRHLPSTTPDTEHEFAQRYRGRKQTIYTSAADDVVLSGIQHKHAYTQSFTKADKANLTAKPDPAPRVIHPRNPRYNVGVGRYIKKIEHDVYRAIEKVFGGPTVAKGRNAWEVGAMFEENWAHFKRPAAIPLDAVRFDQHTSQAALRYEHQFYMHMYKGDRELQKLLSWQLVNQCFGRTADGEIRYKTSGGRMSGDMNTALGNVILMCGMVWTACRDAGVRKFRLVNNGDDCVIIVERRNVQRLVGSLPTFFLRLGYQLTIEKAVTQLEHIEFCQMHPVFDGERWTVVRNFPVCTSKDAISIKPITNPASFDAFRGAIGACGLAAYGNIPVLGAYYDMMLRGVQKVAATELESGFQFLALRMTNRRETPSEAARLSFYEAFGFDPHLQAALEEMYDSIQLSWNDPIYVDHFGGRPELRRPHEVL
jgi:hypothetical protein